jgi:hypothetical protein
MCTSNLHYCSYSFFLSHFSPIGMIGIDKLSYSVTPRARIQIGDEMRSQKIFLSESCRNREKDSREKM